MLKLSPRLRKCLWAGLALGLLGIVTVVSCNYWMVARVKSRTERDPKNQPSAKVALILGTAPTFQGHKNPFFEARMNAAAKLWKEKKVRHFLVSGDNSRKEYDEPSAMREALVLRGVPAEAVTLDYAGFRTLDSMVRAREIFGLEEFVIITDDWHLPRALFLADSAGVKTTGFCADQIPEKWSVKVRYRESLSRMKAMLDVYILRTKPKFLGKRETLPV